MTIEVTATKQTRVSSLDGRLLTDTTELVAPKGGATVVIEGTPGELEAGAVYELTLRKK